MPNVPVRAVHAQRVRRSPSRLYHVRKRPLGVKHRALTQPFTEYACKHAWVEPPRDARAFIVTEPCALHSKLNRRRGHGDDVRLRYEERAHAEFARVKHERQRELTQVKMCEKREKDAKGEGWRRGRHGESRAEL